jgi:1,4-alpha-glucan branching enzyme
MSSQWRSLPWCFLLVAFLAATGCAARQAPLAAMVTAAGVRFEHVDSEARAVAIAGSFNDWSPTATPLVRAGSRGVWSALVPLPAGEHRFMFVVDGRRWVVPARATAFEDDGFGSTNAMVVVPSTER